MSWDAELWTSRGGDLGTLLPDDWEEVETDLWENEGAGWLASISAPVEAGAAEAPQELTALVTGLSFRIDVSVEGDGEAALAPLRQVLETVGRSLGGAMLDLDSGHPSSFAG